MFNICITIIGILSIFVATTIGSACVFFFKKEIGDKLNCLIMGLAGGIMFSACVWGLILPAIEQASSLGRLSFLPIVFGMLIGVFVLLLLDKIFPQISKGADQFSAHAKRTKFLIAITIHNIPEGLIVGLAFGCALTGNGAISVVSALILAVGIALQNVPEGMAVSITLKNALGNRKAFWAGTLSGAVEPIFALIGLVLATQLSAIMPWILAFASGVMLYVTIDDIIPDAKTHHFGSYGFVLGFMLMMLLEIVLG